MEINKKILNNWFHGGGSLDNSSRVLQKKPLNGITVYVFLLLSYLRLSQGLDDPAEG